MIESLAVWLAVVFAAALGTWVVRINAVRLGLMDIPNHRSSHARPTPRGGGLVLAITWIASLGWLLAAGRADPRIAVALIGGGGLIAVIGWWDDRKGLRTSLRLAVQFAASIWTVVMLGGVSSLRFGSLALPLGLAGSVLAVVGLVWMINLYNFMDGIDGLAASKAATTWIFVGVVFLAANERDLAVLTGLMGAASIGFLIWNFPPAKIFMGDVGSGLLGYGFGAVALVGETKTSIPLLVLLLPLSVFILDASTTLVIRMMTVERAYEPHRQHFYQRLVRRGWTHLQVDMLELALNLVLCGLAWVMWSRPELTSFVVPGSIILVVVCGGYALRRSTSPPEKRPVVGPHET